MAYIVKRHTAGRIVNNRRAAGKEGAPIRILSVPLHSELYLLTNLCILEPVKLQSLLNTKCSCLMKAFQIKAQSFAAPFSLTPSLCSCHITV